MLECGPALEQRVQAVEHFSATGQLDHNANIQFGEGGAGTFPDGKLTTRIGDELCGFCYAGVLQHGAPKGDRLAAEPPCRHRRAAGVIASIRSEIEALGGGPFQHCAYRSGAGGWPPGRVWRLLPASWPVKALVLAVGHSARDTFAMLMDSGLGLEM